MNLALCGVPSGRWRAQAGPYITDLRMDTSFSAINRVSLLLARKLLYATVLHVINRSSLSDKDSDIVRVLQLL